LLIQLLRELHRRLPPEELAALLAEVGRHWASELPPGAGTPRDRAMHAVALLEQLGGSAEVEDRADHIAIRGFGCPLGLAVRDEPRVCGALEALVSTVTGMKVRERCDRAGASPSCCFVIAEGA
jgi:predicted ArsR family transcriptional regulator